MIKPEEKLGDPFNESKTQEIFMRMTGYLDRIGAMREMEEALKGLKSLALRYRALIGEDANPTLEGSSIIKIDLPESTQDNDTEKTAEYWGRIIIAAEYRERGMESDTIDRETAINTGRIFVRVVTVAAKQLFLSTEKLGLDPIVGGRSIHYVSAIDMSAIGFNITAVRNTMRTNDDPLENIVTLRDFEDRRLLAMRMVGLDMREDSQFAPVTREWLGGMQNGYYFE